MPRRRTITKRANRRRPIASESAGDAVEAAQAEVLRLRDREIEIWQDRRQMVADLHDLEASTGRQVADGGNAYEAARQLAEGDARLRVQDRAADEVTRQREAAVPLIWRAQAAGERASETANRADAQKRQLRTSELLAELREHEGCEYGPAGRQPGDGGSVAPGLSVIVYSQPRTAHLLAEADEHGRKAAVLDLQQFNPKAGGQVSATTIDELITLGLSDGQRAFPSLREVERWAVDAELAGRKRLRRIRDSFAGTTPDPDRAPATWTLTWRGREIVSGESGVSFLGLSGTGTDDYVDADGGLCRSLSVRGCAALSWVIRRAGGEREPGGRRRRRRGRLPRRRPLTLSRWIPSSCSARGSRAGEPCDRMVGFALLPDLTRSSRAGAE